MEFIQTLHQAADPILDRARALPVFSSLESGCRETRRDVAVQNYLVWNELYKLYCLCIANGKELQFMMDVSVELADLLNTRLDAYAAEAREHGACDECLSSATLLPAAQDLINFTLRTAETGTLPETLTETYAILLCYDRLFGYHSGVFDQIAGQLNAAYRSRKQSETAALSEQFTDTLKWFYLYVEALGSTQTKGA